MQSKYILGNQKNGSLCKGPVVERLNIYSCITSYEHSRLKLFLNGSEAVFKQQNSCSKHEIHVLFEHGFLNF